MLKQDIISKAIKGDVSAFKIIFDYYLPKMRPICLRYAYTTFEAEDILQESFIKVFNNIKDFKSEGSFEGWVKRIVINTALNHHKKNIRHYNQENIEEVNESILGSEEIADIESAPPSELMKLIQELPEGYKLVFNLYVFEEYSHKEIANALDISEGTSRSQYSKAKKMINKLLSRQRIG